MKYYIIAGEASGDLHGSNLMKELKLKDASASFRIWGGDKMQSEGGDLVKHYEDLAFMGFTEVVMNLRTILGNISFCKKDLIEYQPDVLILVDYPGFNLRIAEFAKKAGLKVVYYISPQVWAWKKSRVHKIKAFVDRMFVILPFEKDFYKKYDYDVEYVGHPLLDEIGEVEESNSDTMNVVLLPGSRKQEIQKMLPVMLNVAKNNEEFNFQIAVAPGISEEFIRQFNVPSNVELVKGSTYNLFQNAFAALVTSGTATLEAALFEVPQVVCYKGGKISYLIAKALVDIKYISLVNLIVDRELVKELIQDDMNEKVLTAEFGKIVDADYRKKLKEGYKELKGILKGAGASKKVAEGIVEFLNEK